jgi:hypothetical protein
VLFFMTPFITSVVFTLSAMCLSETYDCKTLLECAYHLPGVQLIRQIQFLKELKTCIEDFNLADKMSKSVVTWIDKCENLDVDKEWSWQMIDECIQDDLNGDTKEYLKILFEKEHGDSFSNVASSELKKLAIHDKKRKAEMLGNLQARIQEFKMCEAYLGWIFYKFDSIT